ncbi:MAG: cobalamin biosynthesis Co2+ chelatase CbiK [Clostridium sp.]|jgi:cobalamin biosynthesis Co2+ chelatase CbiK
MYQYMNIYLLTIERLKIVVSCLYSARDYIRIIDNLYRQVVNPYQQGMILYFFV